MKRNEEKRIKRIGIGLYQLKKVLVSKRNGRFRNFRRKK